MANGQRKNIYENSYDFINRTSNCKEPFNTIFMHLYPFIITHDHETRFASMGNSDKLLLTNPVCTKKTFPARVFITSDIEIWNDLKGHFDENLGADFFFYFLKLRFLKYMPVKYKHEILSRKLSKLRSKIRILRPPLIRACSLIVNSGLL